MKSWVRGRALFTTSAIIALSCVGLQVPAYAAEPTYQFDIPAESLGQALSDYSQASSQQIIFSNEVVAGQKTAGLHGRYTSAQALDVLLSGTDLSARANSTGVLMVQSKNVQAASNEGAAEASAPKTETVTVTGSRILGAPVASPELALTAEDFANAGQTDLGQVIRDIPQNFAGGTNPTAGNRDGQLSSYGSGASTLNLRGLGNDATLTLLNGRRLTANLTSGVDITAIPLAAVQQLEIVTDGASALYGSDAVGGVANVVTKKDYDGLTGTALFGGSTDGGYMQQQYSAVGGRTWEGGGVIGAIAWTRNSEITAGERSYTNGANPITTLIPTQDRLNLFASGHQDIASFAHFGLDALYTKSNTPGANQPFTSGALTTLGELNSDSIESFLFAPNVTIDLPGGWTASAYGTVGGDRTPSSNIIFSGGSPLETFHQLYNNTSNSAEVNLQGAMFALPAGLVRLAAGGGYRSQTFDFSETLDGAPVSAAAGTQTDTYAYGELAAPLISKEQGVRFIRALNISAAVRYEDYKRTGSEVVPQLGLIYDVNSDLTLKASWGKSFKVPEPTQLFTPISSYLLDVSYTGAGSLYPPGSSFIEVSGGNPDLKPEHATSTTFTMQFHPEWIGGFNLSADYFHINFGSRILQPVTTFTGALTTPLFVNAGLVTLSPSPTQQSAAIARGTSPLVNETTGPYNPQSVVGIVDFYPVNAATQLASGVDLTANYQTELSNSDLLAFSISSTYLDISESILPGEPSASVTGNFYQPRNWQMRGGTTWKHGEVTISSFVNFVGGAKYQLTSPAFNLAPVTTVDIVGRWAMPMLTGLDLSLSVDNLFNAKPTVVPGQPYESSYDATAYSAVGRAITISIAKSL